MALIAGRRSRPLTLEIVQAITRVARGERDVQVNVSDHDELSDIGAALNEMIGAVRDNEARLRLLSDNLPNSMVYQLTREPGRGPRFLHVSEGVQALHGISAAQAKKNASLLLSHVVPEDRKLLETASETSMKTMSALDLVLRMRAPDGSLCWRQLRSQPRRESDGRLVWEGIETDVTQHMLATMELKRLVHIVDAHHNAAIWLNRENRIVYVNKATCTTTGYTREELIGQPVAIVSPTLTPERLNELWRELRQKGEVTGEAVRCRKDGTTFPIEFDVTYVTFNGEEYWCSFARNISKRKLAERAAAEAAGRLAVALQASHFGVWRYDFASNKLECDSRTLAIFGRTENDPPPSVEDLISIIEEEDREPVRTSWYDLPNNREPFRERFRIHRPDGKMRHVEVQGVVHLDENHQPDYAIGAAGDITDTVQAITEAAQLRTQLQQAQKMEALGKLAAGVAHDFNNLLTGINGFVELASRTLGPGHEALELLKQARQGAASARTLVRRILDFSRGKQDQKAVLLDLVEITRGTAPLLSAALPPNVSVSLAIECDTAPVLADQGQLQQVLLNLCTNGSHAIGKNTGTVRIGLACLTFAADDANMPAGCSPGDYVRLSVTDTGCGMDEATRKRIFEPFFTTKKSGEGTGLGLSIVQEIVHAWRGAMAVDSTLGVGTTFFVYLPQADIPTTAAALTTSGN